ncbi:hypothetical protein [Carbonactinospora thermoautotrophica]|uniref:hypothetical protein n=1 Tax=Carbonactinospora thermoautotrophica TaxID=1469144 RepID=UPI000A46A5D2|nr:hypothetical protein [Carbonactinospora thermoautotrophica]
MRLELTNEEATVLRELLETYLGDFYMEILHTDNPGYRRLLRTRRATLQRILEALRSPV